MISTLKKTPVTCIFDDLHLYLRFRTFIRIALLKGRQILNPQPTIGKSLKFSLKDNSQIFRLED